EHADKARLAVAVAADDPDAVAGGHAEADGIEHDPGRVLQVQGLGPEKMCHIRPRLGHPAGRPATGCPHPTRRSRPARGHTRVSMPMRTVSPRSTPSRRRIGRLIASTYVPS